MRGNIVSCSVSMSQTFTFNNLLSFFHIAMDFESLFRICFFFSSSFHSKRYSLFTYNGIGDYLYEEKRKKNDKVAQVLLGFSPHSSDNAEKSMSHTYHRYFECVLLASGTEFGSINS